MKKTLLALVTTAMTFSSMAATTNTIATTTSKSFMEKALENTSASIFTGFERTNIDTEATAGYLTLAVSKRFNDEFSIRAQLRSDTTDVTNSSPYKMIDPRIFINAYNRDFDTSLGKLTLAPELRIQPHTQNSQQGNLATLRLGLRASLETTAANTLTFIANGYDNITDSTAGTSVRDESHFYFLAINNYQLNDQNGLTLMFEYFTDIDQAKNIYRSINAQDDVTFRYTNTSINKLSISPYVSQNLSKEVALNMLELGLDLAYTF